jgi:hypothetical protein
MTMLLAVSLGAAEHAAAAELRAGGFLGAHLATIRIGDAPPDLEPTKRTSLALGALLAWRLGESWSIELCPSYLVRGAHVPIASQDVEIRAPFLELPVLATLELTHGRARPFLLAGAGIGIRTSATAVTPSGEQDIGDDFGSTDASLHLGAGMRFPAASAQPFVEVEYAWGLKDLNANASGLGSGLGTIRHRGLQIRAGLSFQLGGK